MNVLRFVSAAALAAIPLGALAGCGAKVATVLSSDDAGPLPSAPEGGGAFDAGSSAVDDTCAPRGGVCLPSGGSAPPNRRIASPAEGRCAGSDVCWVLVESTPDPVCTVNPECNDNTAVSAILGECFHGICVCREGYHVQPSGRCGPAAPGDCPSQGGTCIAGTMTCPEGKLSSETETARSCRSLTEWACCIDKAACRAPMKPAPGGGQTPVEFICCAGNDAIHAPICVHGYQTCQPGDAPVDKAVGGCG